MNSFQICEFPKVTPNGILASWAIRSFALIIASSHDLRRGLPKVQAALPSYRLYMRPFCDVR